MNINTSTGGLSFKMDWTSHNLLIRLVVRLKAEARTHRSSWRIRAYVMSVAILNGCQVPRPGTSYTNFKAPRSGASAIDHLQPQASTPVPAVTATTSTPTVSSPPVTPLAPYTAPNIWTWMSGSSTYGMGAGVQGATDIAAASNVPSGRSSAMSWNDGRGNLWLFGGNAQVGCLNDFWKYDGTNWVRLSGSSNIGNQPGAYGVKGIGASTNIPRSRYGGTTWTDSAGNLWLFGGIFLKDFGLLGGLNDLWKFDGSNWTWVSGSTAADQSGVYGTQGVASTDNMPGARYGAASWRDRSGNLWLFGGTTLPYYRHLLSDLWMFDGSMWVWISGSNSIDQPSVYGPQGEASPKNIPGGRSGLVSWTDSAGRFWLYGGPPAFEPNGWTTLWRFDGTAWTWVAGNNPDAFVRDHTQGYGDIQQAPFSGEGAVSWIDKGDNLWLSPGGNNQVWKFDGREWTFVSGNAPNSIEGVQQHVKYGTLGVPAPDNLPPARSGAVGWTDSNWNVWMFGGSYNGIYFNDLWRTGF